MSSEINSRFENNEQIETDALEMAERGELGILAKEESKIEKRNTRIRKIGVWKLALLNVHRYILLHLAVCVLALITNIALQNVNSENSLTENQGGFYKHALTIDLVYCI